MLKVKKEITIGFVVVLAGALLFYGFYYLKGTDLFKSKEMYYAVYDQVDGISESNSVILNGFKIGMVKDVSFIPDNSGKIVVAFAINENTIKIPKNSIARIISSDLFGTKVIDIQRGNSEELAKPGDTLTSSIQNTLQEEVNAQVLPLKQKAEELISSLDSAVTIVQMVLNKDTRDNLSKSFASIKRAIEVLETASFRVDTLIVTEKAKLGLIFDNLESITRNLRKNNDQITGIIQNFDAISDSLAKANLAQTINNASKALDNVTVIIEKINKGEGSIGMLVNNDSVYNNLERATREMDLLLEDVRVNPKRYVHFSLFGRKEKEGEKQEKKPK